MSGAIAVDTVWTVADSPYVVTNDVTDASFANSTVTHSLFHGIALQSKTAATQGFVLTMSSSSVADSGWLGLAIFDKAAIVTDSTFTGSGFEGIKIALSPLFSVPVRASPAVPCRATGRSA